MVNDFMAGEKGNKIRKKIVELKKKAGEATTNNIVEIAPDKVQKTRTPQKKQHHPNHTHQKLKQRLKALLMTIGDKEH